MAIPRAAFGITCAVTASALFSVGDMAVKFLSGGYALHQVMIIRALVALTLVVALILPMTGGWGQIRTRRPGLHLLRAMCVISANFLFFMGVSVLPLAETVAIFFVAPLLITALSAPLLGERIGPRRWIAVGIGLLGVVVMQRPGSGAIQPAALLVLGGAACYALMHMVTRRLGVTDRAPTMAFYTQVSFVIVSAAVGLTLGDGAYAQDEGMLAFLTRAWVWPRPEDWLVFLMMGLANGAGSVLIGHAYRLCEAGLVAPFEYVSLLMAVFWGAAIFGEWPDAVTWTGIALILGGGLYMMWRESVLARAAR